nr:unnamed protein product [Spirometra erinaceieuropaei]
MSPDQSWLHCRPHNPTKRLHRGKYATDDCSGGVLLAGQRLAAHGEKRVAETHEIVVRTKGSHQEIIWGMWLIGECRLHAIS